jgi:signal transduction histidine kinase
MDLADGDGFTKLSGVVRSQRPASASVNAYERTFIDRIADIPYFGGVIALNLLLFIIFILIGKQNQSFLFSPADSAIFWLPSGVTAAFFIRVRNIKKLWVVGLVVIFFAEWATNSLQGGLPLFTNLVWATANVILCATLLFVSRRLVATPFGFRSVGDVKRFAAITAISVVPSSLVAAIGHSVGLHERSYWSAAFAWALSDALGIILVAPVLLTWTTHASKRAHGWFEAICLFVLIIAASSSIVVLPIPSSFELSLLSILLFFVAWAAIRFGPRASSLAMLLIDIIAVVLGFRFARSGASSIFELLNTQILMGSIALLMLLVAAAIEEQRAARQATEEAVRSRDEFIFVASHELKTPITSLLLQIQMWGRMIHTGKLGTAKQETQIKMVETSAAQVRRLERLIDSLLDVSRISSGKFNLEMKDMDLSVVVREVIEGYSAELSKSNCPIEVRVTTPILGRWDPLRIEQVLLNLLSNACRYGAGKPIEVTARATDYGAEIRVRDHGPGIAPNDQKRIFDRFERASSIHSYGGLGLGLYITRQIVEAHGGSIRVESILGQGSTFFVELPSR